VKKEGIKGLIIETMFLKAGGWYYIPTGKEAPDNYLICIRPGYLWGWV
jgi:hypothetical protein